MNHSPFLPLYGVRVYGHLGDQRYQLGESTANPLLHWVSCPPPFVNEETGKSPRVTSLNFSVSDTLWERESSYVFRLDN